jgi:hypothetical protein
MYRNASCDHRIITVSFRTHVIFFLIPTNTGTTANKHPVWLADIITDLAPKNRRIMGTLWSLENRDKVRRQLSLIGQFRRFNPPWQTGPLRRLITSPPAWKAAYYRRE